jgi:hypothetical protein
MLRSVSRLTAYVASLIKYIKAGGHGSPFILQREAVGGYGRHGRLPPKLFIFYFFYRNFWGEPPVPPIASFLSFSFF